MSSQHFFLRFLAVFLLFTNPSIAFAALSVRLEGKKYPEKSFLVFYHSDDLKVKAVAQGGKIQLSFDQPVEFSVKNSELVDTLAYKVKLSGTNQAL